MRLLKCFAVIQIQIYVLRMIHSSKKRKKKNFENTQSMFGGGKRRRKKCSDGFCSKIYATAARTHKFSLFRELRKGTEQDTEKDHVREPDIFLTNDSRKRHAPCRNGT